MNAIFEQMVEHFEQRQMHYRSEAEFSCLRLDFEGAVGTYHIAVWVDLGIKLCQLRCFAPVRVPEGCRPAVAEAVLRVNYGLLVGKFELNCDDGDLRLHVSHMLNDERFEEQILDRMVYGSLNTMDIYLPAFLSVIYANEIPKEAIRIAEAAVQTAS